MTSTILKYAAPSTLYLGVLLLMLAFQACESMEEENPLLMSIDHMDFESEGSYQITGTLASLGDQEITGFWNLLERIRKREY